MNDLLDYPKIARIPYGQRVGKRYLTEAEVCTLLNGTVVVEEKLDGKTIPQQHDRYTIFGEHLKWVHSTYYDRLPAWFIAFDVWDNQTRTFLPCKEKTAIITSLGYTPVHLIYTGRVNTVDELVAMTGRSAYGNTLMEGVVVKNYNKQLFGKLVRIEFTTGITEHWIKKPKRMNRILTTSSHD